MLKKANTASELNINFEVRRNPSGAGSNIRGRIASCVIFRKSMITGAS